MIILSLNEIPIPLQRHRSRKMGNRIMTYDPQVKEKSRIQMELFNQYQDAPVSGLLSARFEFTFTVPKSYSKKKKEYLLINPYKITRPDLSNYIKFYEDVMNKLIYNDDAQIVEIYSTKKWGAKDSVLITITKIPSISFFILSTR